MFVTIICVIICVIYLISPIDLLPGMLDDFIVILLTLSRVIKTIDQVSKVPIWVWVMLIIIFIGLAIFGLVELIIWIFSLF